MNPKPLPGRPNLEQYKKQAKDLAKSFKANDVQAIQRVKRHCPRLAKLSHADVISHTFHLADAQFVIAREHGFESWRKFAKHVEAKRTEALARESSPAAVWKSAENALLAGDHATLGRLIRENEPLFRDQQPPAYGPEPGRLAPHYSGLDARSIIASNHHFESWSQFAEFSDALKQGNSRIARFEAAVDAVVDGNVTRLKRLLNRHPELIRERSARKNHPTLLHYVGANGVEAFRQKTPKNILKVTKLLLDAGADVNAVADMYGGGATALGLIATSVHPYLAGLQNALIQLLLDHGAIIDHPAPDGTPRSAIIGCLANGRGEAAIYLADRGARLNLESAAGVGRLDVVSGFFDDDGRLKANATKEQAESGFLYACGWGWRNVVEFLLEHGVDPGATNKQCETGLHWAAVGGDLGIVSLLLERGAPIEARDQRFGNTPLRWALYGWREAERESERRPYEDVVALLVARGATVRPEWLDDETVRADERMLAALTGGR